MSHSKPEDTHQLWLRGGFPESYLGLGRHIYISAIEVFCTGFSALVIMIPYFLILFMAKAGKDL